MSDLITIEKIEGNSGVGAPVFSRFGKNNVLDNKALASVKRRQAPATAKNITKVRNINENFKISAVAHQSSTDFTSNLQ